MKTMRTFFSAILGLVVGGVMFAAIPPAKTNTWVEVVFLHPEKYTDVRDAFGASEMGRDGILTQDVAMLWMYERKPMLFHNKRLKNVVMGPNGPADGFGAVMRA